ncbi:MAG: multiheme c-type cytochrome [Anaerolineales bacterium]
MHRQFFLASLLLFVASGFVLWQQNRSPKPIGITPTITGQVEYCLTCHADLPEISQSHPVETFGCVLCHGGEPLALSADLAHSTLRGRSNPSELPVVEASCGGEMCHSGTPQVNRDHIQRVTTSLQATYAGAIAQVRYAFGAQPDLTARMGIYAIDGLVAFDPASESSQALQVFGSNCLSCHLSSQPLESEGYNRWSGCSACHSPAPREDGTQVHRLTTSIPYTQCNACHNRGNYSLSDMQFHPRGDAPTDRLQDYYQPIAEFTRCEWTLDCADCHTRQEAMGDGHIYSTKKDIQYVRCRTCHGTLDSLPLTYTITDENDLALRQAFLNPVVDLKVGDTILMTDKGEPLWNIQVVPGTEGTTPTYELFSKATGKLFNFKPVKGSTCQQKPDQQEARYCHECHATQR